MTCTPSPISDVLGVDSRSNFLNIPNLSIVGVRRWGLETCVFIDSALLHLLRIIVDQLLGLIGQFNF